MKINFRLAAALLVLSSALPCPGAGLERYKDWPKSPEYTWLATDDEKKAWKKVATDEEADHFIQLFWAKRDPDLKTPANEFKAIFDERVRDADKKFGMARFRGALTERGKLYILVGRPYTLLTIPGTKPQPIFATRSQEDIDSGTAAGMLRPANDPGTSIGESRVMFTYDANTLPAWSPVKSLTAVFVVEALKDYLGGTNAGMVNSLEVKARAALVVNPGLKEPPHFRTAAELEAETKAAEAAAAEAAKGPALTDTVRQALEDALSKDDAGALSLFPATYREGEVRLQVQLFVPAPAGAPGPDAKLAILVKNKAGGDAARLEEATAFDPIPGGYLASRFFAVPPGDYGVAADVFDATGKVVASAKRSIAVTAASKDFSLSPLLIAGSFFPAPKSAADQAFTLNGYYFITKGERLAPEDGLSFVVRVYNPAVDPATKTVSLSRTVKLKPKGAPAVDLPQPQDPPIPIPDYKGGDAQGLLTVDVSVVLIDTRLGDYLKRPGEYEIRLVMTDAVSKKTAEKAGTFVVTGAFPPKTAAPAPKK
jgi:GWxTD domain-containing protein